MFKGNIGLIAPWNEDCYYGQMHGVQWSTQIGRTRPEMFRTTLRCALFIAPSSLAALPLPLCGLKQVLMLRVYPTLDES
jgi:hypothetical protein